jgi:hypothetical protein
MVDEDRTQTNQAQVSPRHLNENTEFFLFARNEKVELSTKATDFS